MNNIEDSPNLPSLESSQITCESVSDDGLTRLDDKSLAYVLQARPVFDNVRRVSTQLAALLLLAAAGGRSAQDHPMFSLILHAIDEIADSLPLLRVPTSARHHHRHLTFAAEQLSKAVKAARLGLHRRDDQALDAIGDPLRRVHQELRWASATLPGFVVTDVTQACCASVAPVKKLTLHQI